MDREILHERMKTIYRLLCDEHYVPMKAKEIAAVLNIPKQQRGELQEVLAALLAEGKIEVSERGSYAKASTQSLVGVFTAHPRGFGFVTVEGEESDIFIPGSQVNGAFHKDTVQVSVRGEEGHGRRREGAVTRIVARGVSHIVCTYERHKTFGFAIPDDPRFGRDIFIPQERSRGAVDGHKVVVELTSFGDAGRKPEGKVVEILGHVNDPGVDILSVVRAYELPEQFPEKVQNQAERVSRPVSDADRADRKDLRGWQTVTIDGEDAKDLDDAVTLTREGDRYRLGVHIADVTNYVQERSALDAEALRRGTSVYLADRVIPMLPHVLSNGICSLNAGEDRLALSCIMTIDDKGEVVDHEIAETVICVDRRMSYSSVKKILEDHDEEECRRYEEFVPLFERMQKLAAILRKRRMRRGSIDFDFPETKICLDKEGHPVRLEPSEHNVATRIIEDFMLAANETVAQDCFWQELPFVYRTHDTPDPEKIKKLGIFVNHFGYSIHAGQEEIHPKELQKLLQRIKGQPEEALIARLVLRSMKQARYGTAGTGHFGLATPYYCHFTSPIRRYPDLQIHRIIKDNLRGRMHDERRAHYEKILPEVARQASERERVADEAEREVCKLKKAEYMEAHIGETYEGVISGVTEWGFYVELPNTVEGLVHVTTLAGDFFLYREETCELVGERTGVSYQLGQPVRVTVAGADRLLRTVDFVVAEDAP